MPYVTNADLPHAVHVAHPTEHGQTAFRKTFNSATTEYPHDEETAFKIAHHAADQAEAAGPSHPVHIHIHVHAEAAPEPSGPHPMDNSAFLKGAMS